MVRMMRVLRSGQLCAQKYYWALRFRSQAHHSKMHHAQTNTLANLVQHSQIFATCLTSTSLIDGRMKPLPSQCLHRQLSRTSRNRFCSMNLLMQSTPQQVQITLHRYWKGQLVLNTDLNLCESDSTVWFSTFCELTQTQRAVSWEVLNEFEWYDEQCMPWVCFVGHAGAWHEILIAKGKCWL